MKSKLTTRDIVSGLRALGLKDGDIVLVHGSLSSLGSVEGGAQTVVDAFLDVLGRSGTLLVPTSGDYGAIMKEVKGRHDVVHSIHPKASVTALGARAEEICRDHWKAKTAHGQGTPYLRIADLGGYVCLMGVDQDRNTTMHSAEALLELPYLKTTEEFTFDTPEGVVTRSWEFFPGPHRNFIGLERELRRAGILRSQRIGDGVVRLMKSRDMIDLLVRIGEEDPAFALCDNPNCGDCVSQRAALKHDRFANEDFRFATSSLLAGDDIPEILKNCRTAGIDAVELDGLGGMPIDEEALDEVPAAVDELSDGGLDVLGLRVRDTVPWFDRLVETAASTEVGRVVVPLETDSPSLAEAAKHAGVSISFYNTDTGGADVHSVMTRIQDVCPEAALTFSPANFVRAGEKPFLTSYGAKLKRFIDQLDVEDRPFESSAVPLATGNAEIKELVSILRCSCFSGHMVLSEQNRSAEDLRKVADRFAELLETM